MGQEVILQGVQPTTSDLFSRVFEILGFVLQYIPYWGPPLLFAIFVHLWLRFTRMQFLASQTNVLLEIRLPHEVMKSPVAMQTVLDGIYSKGGEGTFLDRIWTGKIRATYSFEIASFEGQVHFYVWTRAGMRRTVERTFYAHYPDCEILEVEDYATRFPFSLETHDLFGSDYKLAGPIGVPIKTYIDYKLDQTSTKEEQKTDPLSHIVELLGSMGTGEYFWVQIICRANKKEDITYGKYRNKKTYEEIAKEEVSNIRNNLEEKITFPDGKEGKTLSDRQINRIKAMNRVMLASTHWDVGIRALYVAKRGCFDGTTISATLNMWLPFGSPGYNSVSPTSTGLNKFDYPWQDFNNMRQNKIKGELFDAYRRRSWFYPPYRQKHFMLTSEELATLFHIPGTVAKTPTLTRIQSTRGQAPANLPM